MLRKITSRLYTWKYFVFFFISCFLLWNLAIILRRDFTTEVKILPETAPHAENEDLNKLFIENHNRHPDLEEITIKSTIYNDILAETKLHSFLSHTSFRERCMNYFNHLSKKDPHWVVDPDRNIGFYREPYLTFEEYREKKLKAAKKYKLWFLVPSEDSLREKYDSMRQAMLDDDQIFHDFIAHARIFDKCYMGEIEGTSEKDVAFAKEQKSVLKQDDNYQASIADENSADFLLENYECHEAEGRIFPWLTKEYPVFTRWDGTTVNFPGSEDAPPFEKACFLANYKSRLNGRGIVLTLGDNHISDATRFIRVLRHFGNTYPVQVVYTSNLSEKSRTNLVRAARDYFRGYPKVDLWFVNTESAIDSQYINKFGGYSNKVMATMFNSFEEMLLCDADSVLLEDPSYFFELKKYIEKGAFFYKDRTTGFVRTPDDSIFFKKLMPSIEDTVVFNIAPTTEITLDKEFFHGLGDYMESGVVAINRKRHFMQPMMMALMNFYAPVRGRIHGDKELFWLALSIGGDEDYAMNGHFAASIGDFTPDAERLKGIKDKTSFRSKEICSNHPAHISDIDDQSLVWFNSGFRHCGNSFKKEMKWRKEFRTKTRYTNIKTLDEFKTFFRSELKINHAIVPPFDKLKMKNDEHEPDNAWRMEQYCRGYLWCAYSSIGGHFDEDEATGDNMKTGLTITFSPEQKQGFEVIADVWLANFDWE